jgi:hypothetical protein
MGSLNKQCVYAYPAHYKATAMRCNLEEQWVLDQFKSTPRVFFIARDHEG